jgi:hypothetical protein
VTPVVIYPVVAGGLADCTTYTYTVGKAATVNIAVKNASGTVVRHAGPFSDTAGAHTWKWCGRNDANKLVAAGVAYTPQVTATAGGETLTSTAHTVSVKTGYQDAVSPLERFGASNTGGGSGVFCFTHKRWYTSSDLFIRCNGGTVTVSYSFTLPAGTYRTTSSAVTTQPTCCKSPGTITRTATRSGNRMTVTFKVTGKRSLDIRSVRVTAHYKLHV